jgi:hypothetical protein
LTAAYQMCLTALVKLKDSKGLTTVYHHRITCFQYNLPRSGQDDVAAGVQGGGNRGHPALVALQGTLECQCLAHFVFFSVQNWPTARKRAPRCWRRLYVPHSEALKQMKRCNSETGVHHPLCNTSIPGIYASLRWKSCCNRSVPFLKTIPTSMQPAGPAIFHARAVIFDRAELANFLLFHVEFQACLTTEA